jgi:Uma2 family endonuclease
MRLSYVTWQEAANPFIIVELISPATESEDLGNTPTVPGNPPPKWTVYEQILQAPYYGVFNRYTDELKVFKLEAGSYRLLGLSDQKVWIPELNVGLGLWHGLYKQISRLWLRWYDADGNWLLTEAEAERQKARRLAQKLRELGIDPETI